MKKKLITIIITSMIALSLVACGDDKEKDKVPTTGGQVSENNEKDNDNEGNKVAKEDVIKIHEEIIERLDIFYNNNGLPFRTTNTYTKDVEISEHIFNSALAKQTNVDIKDIVRAEYDLTPKFTVDAFIQIEWSEDSVLSQTIIPDFCKAIINQPVDFKKFDEIVKNYVANPNNNSVSETFEIGTYNINIYMDEVTTLLVTIKSNYELK